ITAAPAGSTIVINGTCVGNFTAAKTLILMGGSPGATLNGNATGPVIAQTTNDLLTIDHLRITNGFDGIFSIVTGSDVTLKSATVTGNSVAGVGIYNGDDHTVTLLSSHVDGNTGNGGIFNCCDDDNSVVATNSTVNGNSGDSGIFLCCDADIATTLTNSAVNGNSGNGGVFLISNDGLDVSITGSQMNSNSEDSGLFICCNLGISVAVTGSTVNKNSTGGGGGIFACGTGT